jgi:hypothetical protein
MAAAVKSLFAWNQLATEENFRALDSVVASLGGVCLIFAKTYFEFMIKIINGSAFPSF